jgi:hypothetical protein
MVKISLTPAPLGSQFASTGFQLGLVARYRQDSRRSIVAVVLDTSSSVPDRRLAVWQDIVCDTFVGLDCRSDMRDGFWGSVSQSMIGPVTCTQVDSCAQRVLRTPSRIARANEDFVLVTLATSGVNGVFQDGREAIVSARQFVIYDTTRPTSCTSTTAFRRPFSNCPGSCCNSASARSTR